MKPGILLILIFKLLMSVIFFYLFYRQWRFGYLTQFEYFLMAFFYFCFSIYFIRLHIKTKRDNRTTHLDK
jgi:hypothetical protein